MRLYDMRLSEIKEIKGISGSYKGVFLEQLFRAEILTTVLSRTRRMADPRLFFVHLGPVADGTAAPFSTSIDL